MLLLQRRPLRKFHVKPRVMEVIEGTNALDQIAFCVFHLFIEVQANAGYRRAGSAL